MTSNQGELWNLYTGGYTVSEIARLTGRAKSTISRTLKRAKNPTGYEPCPYSSSCFTCPLRDCALDGSIAVKTNLLPHDMKVRA